jgi:phosphatidylglycerophosphate synthase
MGGIGRRELKTRKKAWPKWLAIRLAGVGVTPNMVSVASMVFGALTFFCWFPFGAASMSARIVLIVVGTISIQLRLLCNLIDGLIAIEGGKKSVVGDIFNDAPDRFSDVAVFAAAGYLTAEPALGWLAALLAVGTAYARTLGTALSGKTDYRGPMAKQHRMFVMTMAGVGTAVEVMYTNTQWVMTIALGIVIVGSAITIGRRLLNVATELRRSS